MLALSATSIHAGFIVRLSLLMTIAISIVVTGLFSGCRSDPYCQTAIANLRAENIQLENQYYELKAMYESDMMRMGQPASQTAPRQVPGNGSAQSVLGMSNWSGVPYYPQSRAVVPATISPRMTGGMASGPSNAEMARFIQSVEVVQLQPQGSETVRLLLRPLDEQGAILPLAGDIRLRMYEPGSGITVFESQFPNQTVAGWINDQAGMQPGIHVALQQDQKITNSDRLICDVQYRTADNRILKQSLNMRFDNMAPAQPSRNYNVKAPMLPEPGLENDIDIQFGNELNFETLDNAASSSSWSPDR
ncbi:MAG: hypothetical protein GY743_07985 [Planctomycetaceae bacterium]|nr:hypothetical protein [Planctomycetaceae bacterium]